MKYVLCVVKRRWIIPWFRFRVTQVTRDLWQQWLRLTLQTQQFSPLSDLKTQSHSHANMVLFYPLRHCHHCLCVFKALSNTFRFFFSKHSEDVWIFFMAPTIHFSFSFFAFSNSKYNLIIVSGSKVTAGCPRDFPQQNGGKKLQVSKMDLSIYCAQFCEVLQIVVSRLFISNFSCIQT